jgi:GNAT superfamily N-acetyltransferase
MRARRTVVCTQVAHGSDEYRQTVALRDEVLRKPLGLRFAPKGLAAEEDSFHLACWDGDALAGCLVLKPLSRRRIRMRQLAVAPPRQGRGLGKALVNFAESFARRRGYQEMVVHARETAVGFYEKLGYMKEGRRFTEVTLPHFGMRKVLSRRGHHRTTPGPRRPSACLFPARRLNAEQTAGPPLRAR